MAFSIRLIAISIQSNVSLVSSALDLDDDLDLDLEEDLLDDDFFVVFFFFLLPVVTVAVIPVEALEPV